MPGEFGQKAANGVRLSRSALADDQNVRIRQTAGGIGVPINLFARLNVVAQQHGRDLWLRWPGRGGSFQPFEHFGCARLGSRAILADRVEVGQRIGAHFDVGGNGGNLAGRDADGGGDGIAIMPLGEHVEYRVALLLGNPLRHPHTVPQSPTPPTARRSCPYVVGCGKAKVNSGRHFLLLRPA
ncbi:MAG TPA: hypothetical protein VFI31_00435 [Pirellulales bacterium]|nr:hypothetical protein [Pirellulales bacterium]